VGNFQPPDLGRIRAPLTYETVRRVLGHKDIRTTIQYYVGLEVEFAARKFDSVVLEAPG